MDARRTSILAKKAELDRLRPLAQNLSGFEHTQDIELTYTSNAIEGNTLTRVETALVVEKGIAIGGKSLRDHFEAIDHLEAVGFIRALAKGAPPIAEFEVRSLHALVMRRSDPDGAGRYATAGRYVVTEDGRHAFPSPAHIPALMADFGRWLGAAPATPEAAFAAHRRLVDIHPFNDGNGRTARLLMNLLLLRGGYPPIAVRPEDRLAYIRALQDAQAGRGDAAFTALLEARLDATLDEYLQAIRDATPSSDESEA